MCWNSGAGPCEECAPDEQEELRAQQVLATSKQIYTKTTAQEYPENGDFLSCAPLVQCASCQAKLTVGLAAGALHQRGTPNPAAQTQERYCTGCGTALKSDQKFCANCGTKN